MKRIIVSVTSDLSTDQRVQRVCQTLYENGFDVLLIGRKLKDSLNFTPSYKAIRFKLLFNRKFLFYAEFNFRLFFFLLFRKADVLISNDLDTLPANYLTYRLKGCKLLFDSHEYFPETPEVFQRTIVRGFWLTLERLFIRNLSGYYTVSSYLAEIYKRKYKISFEVIRNMPFRQKRKPEEPVNEPFIIYQGSVNMGRGLDLAISAMKHITSFELVIAGDGPEIVNLRQLVLDLNLSSRVKFAGKLLPDELRVLTRAASVGISLEEPMGESYIASLPNKLFDYIQAGVPVLVSNLPEMRAVVEKYNVGLILEERLPEALALLLNKIIADLHQREIWLKNLEVAASELCWENESGKLLQMVNHL